MKKSSMYVGTSGWNYSHWKKAFYPEDLTSGEWLNFYQKHFPAVEINNAFYQLPKDKTFQQWKDETPDDFIFTVKASRYITHMKKLKDPEQSVAKFLDRVKILEQKLGPILFQLPPKWSVNVERLDNFFKNLPPHYRYAFEFRNNTWWNEEVLEILKKNNAAFCIYDLEGKISPKEVTADFIYIRLHGPDGAYQGEYTEKTLSGWVDEFYTWQKQGRDVYCFFDNDQNGYAAQDAKKLLKML